MNYRFLEDDDYREITLSNMSENLFTNIRRLIMWRERGDRVEISNSDETWIIYE